MKKERIILMIIMSVGICLRLKYFDLHRFHIDEAIYTSWAIRIYEHFDLFLNGAAGVDKPPVLMYLQAIGFSLFGVSENVARIPNFIASLGSVYFVFLIMKRYYPEVTALLAAFLMAISPLHIVYSNTAFTDPIMVFLCLLSVHAMSRKQYTWAGIWFGAAFGTKVFNIFYLPFLLLLPLWEAYAYTSRHEWRDFRKGLITFGKSAGITIGAVMLITLFSNPPWGFLLRQVGSRIASVAVIQEPFLVRTQTWLDMLSLIMLSKILNVLLILSTGYMVVKAIILLTVAKKTLLDEMQGWIFVLSLITIVIYSAVIVFTNQTLFVRYVLVIQPFLCMILAMGIGELFVLGNKHSRLKVLFHYALLGFIFVGGMLVSKNIEVSRIHVGSLYSLNDGIDQIAEQIMKKVPPQAVLFINESGWSYNFYCHGYHFKEKITFDSVVAIQQGMQKYPDQPWILVWKGDTESVQTEVLDHMDVPTELIFSVEEAQHQYHLYSLQKSNP
jgi:4-amino-4-deoxy-L-arabinose transferase-like glycosyltransferase